MCEFFKEYIIKKSLPDNIDLELHIFQTIFAEYLEFKFSG